MCHVKSKCRMNRCDQERLDDNAVALSLAEPFLGDWQPVIFWVFESLDNITPVLYSVLVSFYSADTSVVVRQFQSALNSFRQKIKIMPSFGFNCLCNPKHHAPLKDSGLEVLQAGSSRGVADPEQCCIHFLINYFLRTPLPLQRGQSWGRRQSLHLLCHVHVGTLVAHL